MSEIRPFKIKLVYGQIPSEEDVYASLATTTITNKGGVVWTNLRDPYEPGGILLLPGEYEVMVSVNGISVFTDFEADNDKAVVLNIPDIYSTIPFVFSQCDSTRSEHVESFQKHAFDSYTSQGIFIYVRDIACTSPRKKKSLLGTETIKLLNSDHCEIDLLSRDNTMENVSQGWICYCKSLSSGLYFVQFSKCESVIWVLPGKTTFLFMLMEGGKLELEGARVLIADKEQFLGNPQNMLSDVLLNKLHNHTWELPEPVLQKALKGDFRSNVFLQLQIAIIYAKSVATKNASPWRIKSDSTPLPVDARNNMNILLSYAKCDLPDYSILQAWFAYVCGDVDPAIPEERVPLLTVSLDFLIELSRVDPEVIPKNSYHDHIIERLMFDAPTIMFSPLSGDTCEAIALSMEKKSSIRDLMEKYSGGEGSYLDDKASLLSERLEDLISSFYKFSLVREYNDNPGKEPNWILHSVSDYCRGHEAKQPFGQLLKRMNLPVNTVIRVLEKHYFEIGRRGKKISTPESREEAFLEMTNYSEYESRKKHQVI